MRLVDSPCETSELFFGFLTYPFWLDCPFNPVMDCGQLNTSVAPLTSRYFSTCTLFLFRPAGLAARPTSVRLSLRLCLFISSLSSIHPSIFCPVQSSEPVVSCYHHASPRPSVFPHAGTRQALICLNVFMLVCI